VRSALLAVKGVTQVRVTLEGHEAFVAYDPLQCKIDTLIAAVANIKDPAMPTTFSATVKKQP
jgi:copper chaperone CopZ